MEINFTPGAVEDLEWWKKTGDEKIKNKIAALLASMQDKPFQGIGKPEVLKQNLSGYWSRRINKEHRIVYTVKGKTITVISLRFHYK